MGELITVPVAGVDVEHTASFLGQLFEGVPGEMVLSVELRAGGWPSRRFRDAWAAAAWVAEMDGRAHGHFVRCTTVAEDAEFTGRGKEKDSYALGFLWADLDYGTVGHRPAPNALPLPPDEEAALQLIADLPDPSVLVHSGGGLHAYWKLDEPIIVTEENFAEVKALSMGWQRQIKAAGDALGWHYGVGVGNLDRVLRLPGTMNRKPA